MKYNFFNEPIPSGASEIGEALMYFDMVAHEANVMIDFDETDGNFCGFSATVSDEFSNSFTTMGYESKEQLLADLRANDINSHNVTSFA